LEIPLKNQCVDALHPLLLEARMEQHCRDMLDAALLNFHSELGRYDWVPSTAMAGDPTDCCIRKQLVMAQWESIVVADSIRQSYFLSADVF